MENHIPKKFFTHFKQFLAMILRRFKNETRQFYLLEMPLSERPLSAGLQIQKKHAWDASLELFSRLRQKEDPLQLGRSHSERIKEKLAQGDCCYMAMDGDIPLGIIIAGARPYYLFYFHYYLDLPQGVIALNEAYLLSAYRQRGYYRELFNYCVNDWLQQGYHTVQLWIVPTTLISFKVHNKLGVSHVIRKLSMRQKWGFRWHQVEDLDLQVADLLKSLP